MSPDFGKINPGHMYNHTFCRNIMNFVISIPIKYFVVVKNTSKIFCIGSKSNEFLVFFVIKYDKIIVVICSSEKSINGIPKRMSSGISLGDFFVVVIINQKIRRSILVNFS